MADLNHFLKQIPDQFGKLEAMIKQVFKTGQQGQLTQNRVQGWIDEMVSNKGVGGRKGLTDFALEDQIRDDIAKYIITSDVIQNFYGVDADTAEQLILGGNEGGINFSDLGKGTDKTEGGGGLEDAETGLEPLTILRGKDMQWFLDRSTGKWYVRYGLPNSDKGIIFEADPDQMEALFGPGGQPPSFTPSNLNDLIVVQDNVFAGNVGEMEGDGTLEDEMKRVISLALDEGILPEWAEDVPEIMDFVFIAQSEGKSSEWLVDQIAQTQVFKERFEGIDKLKADGNLTWEEAVGGYLEYEAGVKSAIEAIGLNAALATPEVIGALMAKGHALSTVQKATAKFKRMQEYAPALAAFNSILVENEMDPITDLQGMFDFVSGDAPSQVYDIWEASSMAEAATAAGLGDLFTAEDALQFALESEGNVGLESATGMFQSLAQTLLRFRGEIIIGDFDLDPEDILDMSLGRSPRSGQSTAQLQSNMNRAISSAQANLRGRGGLFKSFDERGRPGATGLTSLRAQN